MWLELSRWAGRVFKNSFAAAATLYVDGALQQAFLHLLSVRRQVPVAEKSIPGGAQGGRVADTKPAALVLLQVFRSFQGFPFLLRPALLC